MIKQSTTRKVFMLMSSLVILIGCAKKTKKINFNDIEKSHDKTDGIIIQSILSKEENELFEYKIRIPKITDAKTKNNSLKAFNEEIESYANEIVKNLKSGAQNIKKDFNKPSLKIDYEIYHGYGIYTIIVNATQEINNTSITNYRSYYISDNGDYIYNIDEIINVEESFPYFTQKIKEKVNKTQLSELLFDLQQAVIYFEDKKIIIKFPIYVFNLDDTKNIDNIFEFSEEEATKYIKKDKTKHK
ncbi:hypothetical protein BmHG_00231 [Borrelia miyamotoi]|uniref:Uncharacterized protein n=1 Tax=Borrelia miyamotoi TaxID=47466 RepID=A0AAP9CG86_9SPIR|nr:hypothetical protein [Borrelia miyamotoi]AHH05190.1 Hypothetical protein BOM_0647 [Borrelia miyamotoi FR64b]ATQ14973.1 hypothetical protein CNO14_03145 [Borrelia miyamotoi]ATQ16156.1 hypothetical protein CNO13_03145 [Borrelia miyamotoi]ATQ17301.1 hypothetical protein CNO12_03150 [Borrelia miyamotoi]ATQ18193.1 hypothetical protein CNO11_01100 [Borrelia miyamotoi]